MKYKNVSLCAVIILILTVILIAFFCIMAFSTSYGYSTQVDKSASPVGNLDTTSAVTIIIDAGHGGVDPGAVANNVIEKNINLSVAKKLADFLSISGYNVVLTREEDVLLGNNDKEGYKRSDLNHRLSFIEKNENCIFVSIHMNKFETSSAHGLQTFYSSNNPDSLRLAEAIQAASKLIDANNTRKVKPDGSNIYILEKTYKPAVLVECGFLSNPTDASKLSDNSYQNKLAFSLYCGIINYIGE